MMLNTAVIRGIGLGAVDTEIDSKKVSPIVIIIALFVVGILARLGGIM